MRKILPVMPGEDSRSDEHARAVDQGLDAAEPSQRSADDPVGDLSVGGSPVTVSTPGSSDGVIVRALVTTPCLR